MGSVNKKRILGVFASITDTLIALEDYMIDIDTIILDPQYIYADVTTNKVALICLPIDNISIEASSGLEFFKKIMYGVQFDQSENCTYVANIINFLNSSEFSLQEFSKLLNSLMKEDVNKGVSANPTHNTVVNKPDPVPAPVQVPVHTNQGHVNSGLSPQAPIMQPPQIPQFHGQVPMDNTKDKKTKWSLFKGKKDKDKPEKQKAPKN